MRIIVFCLPGIGDALMATPMIKLLKKNYPAALIDLACMFSAVGYLFKNNKSIQKVYFLDIYNKNKLFGIRRVIPLRSHAYDVSILAFPAFRREYHIVQWLVGAKKRIAHVFKKGYWSECNFLDTHHIPVEEKEHNVINNLNLLKSLGIHWEEKIDKRKIAYQFGLDKKDRDFGKKYIQNLGWEKDEVIGIHPGSINSPAGVLRRWPIEKFAELSRYLIKKKKQKILLFAGPFEPELGEPLANLIDDNKNCKLVNNVQFNQSVGILNSVSLLISNDNGYAHVANALGIKTIILFGPTNMKLSRPYNNNISVYIRKAKFTPWFKNSMKVTDIPQGLQSGMELIEVDDVINAYDSLVLKARSL